MKEYYEVQIGVKHCTIWFIEQESKYIIIGYT